MAGIVKKHIKSMQIPVNSAEKVGYYINKKWVSFSQSAVFYITFKTSIER